MAVAAALQNPVSDSMVLVRDAGRVSLQHGSIGQPMVFAHVSTVDQDPVWCAVFPNSPAGLDRAFG